MPVVYEGKGFIKVLLILDTLLPAWCGNKLAARRSTPSYKGKVTTVICDAFSLRTISQRVSFIKLTAQLTITTLLKRNEQVFY